MKEQIEKAISAYETNDDFTLEHFYCVVKAITFWGDE